MGGDKKRLMWLLLLVLAMLLSTVGLTYAWMTQRASMTTLLTITPPDSITIIPISANGSEMAELDLDFQEDRDKKDGDGTVHILRPVCIKSTELIHQLEVVHTTNLGSLGFNIYPVTKEGIKDFSLDNKPEPLVGHYKNQNENGLAEPKKLGNYQEEDIVEKHAFPLYWITGNCDADQSNKETGADGKTYFSTYYILEIIWNDETKETDLFYIIAQNVAQ